MSKKIFKYEVKLDNPYEVIPFLVPDNAELLDIQCQDSEYGKGLFSWWIVETENVEPKKIEWFSAFTGEDIPDNFGYLKTLQLPTTGLVLHIYERLGVSVSEEKP